MLDIRDMHLTEVGAVQMCTVKRGVGEVRPSEVGAAQTSRHETSEECPGEVLSGEIGAAKVPVRYGNST